MSDTRDETSGDGSHHSMVVEVFFAFLYLRLVEHTHVSPPAVGKAVDDWPAKIVTAKVVDCCTNVGSNCTEKYHEPNIHIPGRRVICRRSYDKLRGHRYYCALEKMRMNIDQ